MSGAGARGIVTAGAGGALVGVTVGKRLRAGGKRGGVTGVGALVGVTLGRTGGSGAGALVLGANCTLRGVAGAAVSRAAGGTLRGGAGMVGTGAVAGFGLGLMIPVMQEWNWSMVLSVLGWSAGRREPLVESFRASTMASSAAMI